MRSAGIIPNLDKLGAREITLRVAGWLEENGFRVWMPTREAAAVGREELGAPLSVWVSSVELVLVLGGDGTLLSAARSIAPSQAPLLGVNLGRLGFLTEVELPELFGVLPAILRREYKLEERMMLEALLHRGGQVTQRLLALNEVVVTKGSFARLVSLHVAIDESYVDTYPADGLIIATPTGSTAYSLSAGGPIVNPNLEVMIITPICPHTLYWRSLVIASTETVKVKINPIYPGSNLTVDGQYGVALEPGDEIVVRRADATVRLVRLPEWNFYEVLRRKLKEGDSRFQ
ncbi:MAG: NAD(+)/NADH kinase [Bacillota bacterium]